jgi:hypothetical protein
MDAPDLLTLTRTTFLDARTLGTLGFKGEPFGYTCEDTDRGLDARMPAALLVSLKIKRSTAIPVGRYQLVWARSPSRGVETPRLLGVPGFQGILIHPGNDEADTEGCILPGTVLLSGGMGVGHSQIACSWLYPKIRDACASGPQYITVRREPVAWTRRCNAVPGLGWEP